jgi:hypothetical protein
MINKKMQGMIMLGLGTVLFLVIVDHAFFRVFSAFVSILLISYGLHLIGKPGLPEYAQRLFNIFKS